MKNDKTSSGKKAASKTPTPNKKSTKEGASKDEAQYENKDES